MPPANDADTDRTSERTTTGRALSEDDVDLHELARILYRLMKEEARVERERLGRRQTR